MFGSKSWALSDCSPIILFYRVFALPALSAGILMKVGSPIATAEVPKKFGTKVVIYLSPIFSL